MSEPTDIPEQKTPTLGEIAEQLQTLKASGVTRGSILYVVDRVWWKELDEEEFTRQMFARSDLGAPPEEQAFAVFDNTNGHRMSRWFHGNSEASRLCGQMNTSPGAGGRYHVRDSSYRRM